MEQIIKKIIGNTVHTFVVSGENFYDVVTESQKLSFPDVECCGKCGSKDLVLGSHLGKDDKGNMSFKYVDIKCMNPDCRASLTFGQPKKDPNTFYLRKNDKNEYDWKPYAKPETQQAQPPAQKQSQPAGKPAPAKNQGNHVNHGKQLDAPAKPSGKAINYATKISTAGDKKSLDEICGKVKGDKDFNDIDLEYLRKECARKQAFFNSMPLS